VSDGGKFIAEKNCSGGGSVTRIVRTGLLERGHEVCFYQEPSISSAFSILMMAFLIGKRKNAPLNAKSGSKTVLCDHAGDCQKTHPAC